MTEYASLHPNLTVASSKAHELHFSKMRNVKTSSLEFTTYARRSMRILAEEALAAFPTEVITFETPCGPCEGLKGPEPCNICAVSIVRSGDALVESVRDVEPGVRVGKILIQRDESTKEKLPTFFYSKMPPGVEDMHILLCDPMLATGGSAKMAIDSLISKHKVDPAKIIFANMICCPEGLTAMKEAYPQVKIVTAKVDKGLNDQKYIVPGLGDYGDRFFGT